MLKSRIIAVVIVESGRVVQSEQFRHPHVIHYDAMHAVDAFSSWSVDEIMLINVSRSGESRDGFLEVVQHCAKKCFVPLCAGGQVNSVEYGRSLIALGADKICLNTAFHADPDVARTLSNVLGRQAVVASIDVRTIDGQKRVFVDRGREDTGVDPVTWASACVDNGAGEILITSIDHEGMRGGYDRELVATVSKSVSVPVIAFGGVSTWEHFLQGFEDGADAVAAANIFHYKEQATKQAKKYLLRKGVNVRK